MVEARQRAEWSRASLVCATLVNANPFRKGKPVPPDAFSPFAAAGGRRAGADAPVVGIHALRVFVAPPPAAKPAPPQSDPA